MKNETDEIVDCLLRGGIALVPTDTVYGLAVCPNFEEPVDRLYALKCRPRNLNLPIMVSSADELEVLGVDINDRVRKLLASAFIPGALTLAMGFTNGPLVPWLMGREEVAIRIPDDRRLLSVLRKTGPLFVTSANRHGRSTRETIQDILGQLEGKPDIVIDGGILQTVPSTLVNCRHHPLKVEREGSISKTQLWDFIG